MIKQNNRIYLLKRPNNLIKSQGKNWTIDEIKYVNFDKLFRKIVSYSEENIQLKQIEPKQNIVTVEEIEEPTITIEKPKEIKVEKKIEYKQQIEEPIKEKFDLSKFHNRAGSVVYYIHKYNNRFVEDFQIFAKIEEISQTERLFVINLEQWKDKINYSISIGSSISCLWDATEWHIDKFEQVENNYIVYGFKI